MSTEHYDHVIAIADLYREVFSDPKGRAVLLDMIEKCGLYTAPAANIPAEVRAYNDGYRAAVLHIVERAEMTAEEMQLLYRRRNALAASEHARDLDG